MLEELLKAFILLFIIMDPFASLPVFIAVTKGLKKPKVFEAAQQAVVVAGVLLYAFLFFGSTILSLFKVSFSSFQIAGGLVLLLMAVEIVLGIKLGGKRASKSPAGIVIIGTPLLTGPGVITTVTVLSNEAGVFTTAIAGFGALVCTLVILRNANWLAEKLGEGPIEALSKIMGLLLAAVAVQMIRTGLGL